MISNIYILVILFGLISVVLQRMRGAPPGERQGGMPPFGQGPRREDLPRRRPVQRTQTEPTLGRARPEQQHTAPPNAAPQAELKVEPPVQPVPTAPTAATASTARVQVMPNVPAMHGNSNSKGNGNGNLHPAVQGMMWAEVFGPPRAKRPYNGKR